MPGIYVRKAKWIDWIQQRENPVLTVPGSYWLCHKNNIYKFIFRYHRTMRNTEQFNHGRELMKVIRRIIKNQPRQGQQFGTNHLLVTYSHTSWTRQDKMFALLKFKERSVAAFSHAFVLTIKILFSLENIEQNTNSVKQFPFSDKSEVQSDEESVCVNTCEKKDKKENKCSTYSRGDISKKHKEYNIQDEALEPKNKNTELGNNLIVSDLTKATTNEESVKDKSNCENNSRVPKTSKISVEVAVKHNASPENYTKFNKAKEKLKKENRNKNTNSRNSTLLNSSAGEVEESEVTSNANNIQLSNSSGKLLEANKYTNKKDFTERKSVSNTNKLLKDNSVDSANVDSINLPYQYLMEKEVEDAKQKILSNNEIKNIIVMHNRDEQSSKRHKLEEIDEKYSSNPAAKDSPSPKRRKHSSDNLTAKSSDITDLVMEGLMFTIRQGQDAVAVIEQKTKLEIDEVLENSEKIETTKGKKCLRNSSLLGLENLITMLDLPNQTEAKRKCENAVIRGNMLEGQRTSKLLLPTNNGIKQQNVEPYLKYVQWDPNTIFEAGASFTNNNENSKIYDEREYNNTKIVENEDTECEEEEEEDIVPEALQDEIFQQSISCFQTGDKLSDKLKVIVNKDLLMDDMDAEESPKSEALESKLNPFLDRNLLPKIHELSAESTANEAHKYNTHCRPNVPIIVSNEIITADQIPLPLQKILKNELSTVNKFKTSDQETCQEKDIDFSLQLKGHTVHSNMLQSTRYPGNSQTPMHSINGTRKESTLSVTPNAELENVSTTDCNLELSREEPQKLNVNTGKEEQSLPNKLQDVTHEFCQELLHLQRRENLIDQKCLRSRKSLKDVGDSEARVEMIKFFHDITRGAKVVIRRMSTKSIHNILGKSSSLATCIQH